MGLCLLVYTIGQRQIRTNLALRDASRLGRESLPARGDPNTVHYSNWIRIYEMQLTYKQDTQ